MAGDITFTVDLDEADAEKRLKSLKNQINRLDEDLKKMGAERLPLAEQVEELKSRISEAQAEANKLRESGVAESDPRIQGYVATIRELRPQLKDATDALEKMDAKTAKTAENLAYAKGRAGELEETVSGAAGGTNRLADAANAAARRFEKLGNRIIGLARRVFVFTLITKALRALRTYIGDAIKQNNEATAAIARLKGALLTLAQPILQVLIPAITALINVLTKIVSVIAQIVSMLFGKSFSATKQAAKNLNAEQKALKGVGKAAKEAEGSLAGFDEINTIATGGSSGGAGASDIAPDFDFGGELDEGTLKRILDLLKLIGAAILAFKFSDSFLGGLKAFAGFLLVFDALKNGIKQFIDLWNNGLTFDGLGKMIGRIAEFAAGLFLIFGKVGGAIGLIIGGLSLLVLGIKDAIENGWNAENLLTTISGLLLGGLGISVLTGSWIPLLVAGIAGALLALTVAMGEGENLIDGFKTVLHGFIDFFTGVFAGDWEKAINAVAEIFTGFGKIVDAVLNAIKTAVGRLFDWLDEKTHGKITPLLEFVKSAIQAAVSFIRDLLQTGIKAAEGILQGLINFIVGVFTGDWQRAWNGIKDIFKSIANGIIGVAESLVNLIIRALNTFVRGINKISFDIPDWVPVLGGKKFGFNIPLINEAKLPRLATGAVVPPNREFMAMLGDNKKETEVVSPISTMKQAFMEALAESGGNNGTIVINLDGRKIAEVTVKNINRMSREAGKPVVVY